MNPLTASPEVARGLGERFGSSLKIAIGCVTFAGITAAAWYEPTVEARPKTVEEAVSENMATVDEQTPAETVPTIPPPPLPPEMLNPPCVSSPIPWMPESVSRWYPLVAQSASIHAVPPEPLEILEFLESFGNPIAESVKGALGLIQIMPDTANSLASSLGLPPLDLRDPASNIYLAGKYVRNYIDSGDIDVSQGFNSESMRQTAIVYNGGLQRLINYKTKGFDSLPNETKIYSNRAVLAWEERHSPTSQVLNEYMSMSGPRNLQAAGANLGTPPCQ